MVKLAGLIPVAAAAQGLPEAMVFGSARKVREAGGITSGPRGPGGAEMTEQDATNLLLGITCAAQIKDAGDAAQVYRHLFGLVKRHMIARDTGPPVSLCPEPLRWLAQTAQGQTLGDALDRLIGMARTGELQSLFRDLADKHVGGEGADREARIDRAIDELGAVNLRIEFRRPRPGVTLVFSERGGTEPYLEVEFGYLSAMETPEEMDRRETGDRVETVTITNRTIFALGEALRQ
jgi:hypothetical protein